MKRWTSYAFWILLTELIGVVAAALTMENTRLFSQTVEQPPFAPPAWIFPVVWTVLYALMGIGVAKVSLSMDSSFRRKALNLFVAQLTVNFFWSLIFFNAKAYGFALLWLMLLWVMILWMIFAFAKVDKTAALLQIPYLLWVAFAGILNYWIWRLN